MIRGVGDGAGAVAVASFPATGWCSGGGRGAPQVDVAVDGVAVNIGELIGSKLGLVESSDILFELGHAAGADQHRRDEGSRKARAMAIWASDCRLAWAISFSTRMRARLASLSISWLSEPAMEAREPGGYL